MTCLRGAELSGGAETQTQGNQTHVQSYSLYATVASNTEVLRREDRLCIEKPYSLSSHTVLGTQR